MLSGAAACQGEVLLQEVPWQEQQRHPPLNTENPLDFEGCNQPLLASQRQTARCFGANDREPLASKHRVWVETPAHGVHASEQHQAKQGHPPPTEMRRTRSQPRLLVGHGVGPQVKPLKPRWGSARGQHLLGVIQTKFQKEKKRPLAEVPNSSTLMKCQCEAQAYLPSWRIAPVRLKVVNTSQSIHRCSATDKDICPCLTPGGQYYLPERARLISWAERALLMGLSGDSDRAVPLRLKVSESD